MINTERIRELPVKPGCYLFKNKEGQIIYIGKANNLKRRVTSYFQGEHTEKKRNFIPQIEHLDIFVTNNQKEALILEQNLIKKHQPRYNVLLKSGNCYPYILVTNDKNPRYLLTYKVYAQQGNYFGPFPEGSRAKEILNLLERVLPLARCKATKIKKPCLYYSIRQCSGHCFKEVDPTYYENTRKEIINFFEGNTDKLKSKLLKSFQQSVQNLSFEIAQKQKKVIDSIDFFTTRQHVEFNSKDDYDFLGTFSKEGIFSVNMLIYRYGKLLLSSGKSFALETQLASEEEIVQSYIFQFYKQNTTPSVLYSAVLLTNKEVFETEFQLKNLLPSDEQTRKILAIAVLNAEERWNQGSFNNFQSVNQLQTLEKIASLLQIPVPFKIEALDISNIFLDDAVACFSVFVNGEYKNSKLYRLAPERSDSAYMRAACRKHYQQTTQETMPTLIVVDGASEQLKAVISVLAGFNLTSKVVGLIKNAKHQTERMISDDFTYKDFTTKEVKDFFTQIQETVHNKAITSHRKLHAKNTLKVNKLLP